MFNSMFNLMALAAPKKQKKNIVISLKYNKVDISCQIIRDECLNQSFPILKIARIMTIQNTNQLMLPDKLYGYFYRITK